MLQRWKEKVPHSHCTLWNFKSLVSGLALNEGGQNIDHYHEGEACCFHRSPDPIPLLRSIILYNLTWAQHGPAFFIGKRCCVQLMHWFRNDPRSSVFDLFIPFKAYFMHLVQTNPHSSAEILGLHMPAANSVAFRFVSGGFNPPRWSCVWSNWQAGATWHEPT